MKKASHPVMNDHNLSLAPIGFIAALIALTLATGSHAGSITKAATGTDLTAGVSWGGTPPGSGDVATWASASLGAGLTLGTSSSWSGINVASAASAIDVTGAGALTLGSGGIDMSVSAVNLTLGTPITLGASQTWTVSSGRTLNAAGIISGTSAVLTKAGAGTLRIEDLALGTGTVVQNTYSGGTIMNSGTLHLGGMYNGVSPDCSGALGTGPVTLNGGTIEFDRYTASNALTVNGGTLYGANGWGVRWNGTVTLNADLTIKSITYGGPMQFNGKISGTGGVILTGSYGVQFTAANDYTGPTTVTAGTLQCDTANSLGGGPLSISSGAKMNLNYSGTKAVSSLTLGGVAQTVYGTYGSSTSGATVQNNTYFTGSGTVTVSPIITSFGIPGYAGVINQTAKTIALTVPYGTSLATLAPTFTVTFGTCNQTSGSPPSPTFAASNPAHYIVSSGGFQNDYAVTVTVAPVSTACDILTFGLPDNPGVIDQVARTITLNVPANPGVTSLAPTYTVSQFATGSPTSGTTRNFTNPQTYTVTAQDGTTQKTYTVTAQTYQSWTYSGSIFILTNSDGANLSAGASETNFPLLVRFNSNNFNFGQAASDGSDIRFTTVAGTALYYEIEQWDSVNGQAAVWVRIPTITGNARQEIKMYWGKSGVASQSNGTAVFNSSNGYCSVMHLNGNVVDSTGSTSPVNGGATPTTAIIGSTAMNLFSGDITASNITNFPSGTNPTSTGEVWIRARQISSGWCMPLAWGNKNAYGWNTWNMQIGFWGSPTVLPAPLTCRGPALLSGSTALAAQQWYHVVYTNSGGTGKLYVNGALDGTASGGSLSITNPQAMVLTAASGDADVDEARISSVVRSADWVKMEYENQKPQQTLVGTVVQTGSTFSATPPSVTMNEGTTTTLSGQAGGAQKVYWCLVQNGVETVLATDQFTYTVSPGRITGNQSFVIRFKGIYPTGNQTVDIPVTVTETIPDPVFTLNASTTQWDGRQTMTVTPVISNLAALQAAGVANLTYNWGVAGVAVSKTITAGTPSVPGVLTLTRSQGSGPMTVSLTLDNGGAKVSSNVTIAVQEPASDSWVQRTPGANEKAVNNQFYARDPNTGYGTLYYNGTQTGSPASVFLKVYTTDTGTDVQYGSTWRQTLTGTNYAFTVPIAAGKVTYKVVYGTTNGSGVDTNVATVTNLVCGDAYIIDGQSNALATDNTAPNDSTTDPWIRTYGLTGGWGYAISKGTEMQLGLWGWYLAKYMTSTYNIPVCFIQGAVGGTRIDQHQPNPADHSAAGSLYSIYANIYNRVVGAKLTHGIRGVFWHQGESNSGAAAPTGDWDYKSYQQYFVDMSAAWKQDFPNIQRYIIWQVMPKPCAMGPKGDQLREAQRTLPRLFSKMDILCTLNTVGYEGCHFSPTGYQNFANLVAPLVGQDFYGIVPADVVTAPNLKRAWFTTSARTEIALEFDQNMGWNTYAKANFYLDKVSGKVSSGSASGNVVKLQLTSASTATAIDYLEDNYWNYGESVSSLLYGANTIPALTFADVGISPAALAQSRTTAEDTPLPITLSGTSVSGTTLTYAVVSQPAHGTLSGTAPNLTYTPAANYNGPDSFTFKVNDGTLDSVAAAISLTVTPVNDPPVAQAQDLTTEANTALQITLAATDVEGGSLTYAIVSQPAHGTLSGTAPAVTYTPTAGYSGSDSFTFKANDGSLDSTPATVSITVSGSGFSAWAGNPAQGLTRGVNDGPLDDPDRDGIPNLLEFVLGGSPMSASRTILPVLGKPGTAWVFEYDRSRLSLPPDTVQVVEYGSDLTGWTPVMIPATTAAPVTITPGTSSDHVSVILPDQGAQGFVRLKVSQ